MERCVFFIKLRNWFLLPFLLTMVGCYESTNNTTDDTDPEPGDTDTDSDDCPGYPAGPYYWYKNYTVPWDTEFPAKYGPDGPETVLNMCDVWENRESVKALVFAIGTSD